MHHKVAVRTLSGLTMRDELNPDGCIELAVTGMSPGEKLYEVLLTGSPSYDVSAGSIYLGIISSNCFV